MAEISRQAPAGSASTPEYWCYHCNKLVSVVTVDNLPDEVICGECKNDFADIISSGAAVPSSAKSSLAFDPSLDPFFDSQFLEELQTLEQDIRDDQDAPPPPQQEPLSDFSEEEVIELGDGDREEYMRRWLRNIIRQLQVEFEVGAPDRYTQNLGDYLDTNGSIFMDGESEDGGKRGAPPAATSAVSALPRVEIISEEETVECAVCKDGISVGETETKLPCGHGYHGDCILPWLASTNSCPVCRFQLPTDDPDYEEKRKKKLPPSLASI